MLKGVKIKNVYLKIVKQFLFIIMMVKLNLYFVKYIN